MKIIEMEKNPLLEITYNEATELGRLTRTLEATAVLKFNSPTRHDLRPGWLNMSVMQATYGYDESVVKAAIAELKQTTPSDKDYRALHAAQLAKLIAVKEAISAHVDQTVEQSGLTAEEIAAAVEQREAAATPIKEDHIQL